MFDLTKWKYLERGCNVYMKFFFHNVRRKIVKWLYDGIVDHFPIIIMGTRI